MNVSSLGFNFADFELLHCYKSNLQNKSHAKFKAFTVLQEFEAGNLIFIHQLSKRVVYVVAGIHSI